MKPQSFDGPAGPVNLTKSLASGADSADEIGNE